MNDFGSAENTKADKDPIELSLSKERFRDFHFLPPSLFAGNSWLGTARVLSDIVFATTLQL
jgi:hypothetical protein